MSHQTLEDFSDENKEAIGAALPRGTRALGEVLSAGAAGFGLTQRVQDEAVQWLTDEGDIALMFCGVADPRDLDRMMAVFSLVRDKRPRLGAVFVHQWTDGEGNWDVFLINSQRVLHHADRISGSETVRERGPSLRDDIYSFFACGREWPAPGRARWAELLDGPAEAVAEVLGALAAERSCIQRVRDSLIQWVNRREQVEAQFLTLAEVGDVGAIVGLYHQIRDTGCPVTFVFVKGDRVGLYDVFRLSSRSYLEHHNQAKASISGRAVV